MNSLRLMTFEEAMECAKANDWVERVNKSIERNPFLEEAKTDDRCAFIIVNGGSDKDLHIIVKDKEYSNVIGFYIGNTYRDGTFGVWEACYRKDYNNEDHIGDGGGIAEYEYKEGMTLDWLISDLQEKVDTCPICGKKVGRENMRGYSFAGRCCEECLPEMKKKYEYKGWYN